jgi:ferredoxin
VPAAIPAAGTAAGGAAPASAPAAESAPAESGAPAEPEPEPEPEEPAEEAWINTPLCTSCNDCMNVNPRMFVYDANKQAVIGDVRAGTFAQLVQAAEKCPARCIHPGQPWNPDEPGLDKLIERAAPLQ